MRTGACLACPSLGCRRPLVYIIYRMPTVWVNERVPTIPDQWLAKGWAMEGPQQVFAGFYYKFTKVHGWLLLSLLHLPSSFLRNPEVTSLSFKTILLVMTYPDWVFWWTLPFTPVNLMILVIILWLKLMNDETSSLKGWTLRVGKETTFSIIALAIIYFKVHH